MGKIRVIVLEDHPFQRAVLEYNLASFSDVDVLSTLGFGGWARIRLRGQRLKEEK